MSAVEQLLLDLSSLDLATRMRAIFVLCEDPERAEPALVAQLRDESGEASGRHWAAFTLGRLERNAYGAVEALRCTLATPDVDLRMAVLRALGQLKAVEAVPDIARHLGDTEESAAAWFEEGASPAAVARAALAQIGTPESLAFLARRPAG